MFEIKIDDARYWKSCVDAIASMIDEGSFTVTKEGVGLKAMDPSGISMVAFSIPNKAFSKFNVDKDAVVGLNISNFKKMLESARAGEQITMKDSSNKLAVEFSGSNGSRRYRLPMIDVKKDSEREPKIVFESIVEVKSDSFKEMLKDANVLSTYVSFKTDKGTFSVLAKGDPGELEESHGGAEYIKKLEVTKPASATFNLEYLQRIVSGCPSDSALKLSLKTEEPIRVEYNIVDAAFSYYLAPYMES